MAQVSRFLRRATNGYSHWCPGCEEMHFIKTDGEPRWGFNGDVDCPTFTPSVRITGKQTIVVDGGWTGEWVHDAGGNALDACCHYFLTNGVLNFCDDCTHALSGQSVPLPSLPDFLTDDR